MIRTGPVLAGGAAEGLTLVLSAPLSFWGGIEAATGRIIDRSHPDLGTCITGRVLVMPGGRGSSSSSSVLAETIRRGTGPAAIVLGSADPILTVGSLVARFLYGIRCPVVVCPIENVTSDVRARVSATDETMAAEIVVMSD